MNHYVYVSDIMKDVSKDIDYLKAGSLQHVTSYFWWGGGGIEIEQLHKGTEIEKNDFSSKPL